eukprot:6030549-Amphidinium_carterae.1
MSDIGVEEGYLPTEVVDGEEGELHPPLLVPGSQGSAGLSGSEEHLGVTPDSVGAEGSGVQFELPRAGSVGAESSGEAFLSASPSGYADPWSGASAASVAHAVEV